MSKPKQFDDGMALNETVGQILTMPFHLQGQVLTPRGTEVLFKFGNMVEVAPARVLFVTEFGGFIRVRVRNLRTGGKRNIPLDAIEKVWP